MADIRVWMKSATKTAKDWFGVTGQIFKEGESDEIRAMDVGIRGSSGGLIKTDSEDRLLIAPEVEVNADVNIGSTVAIYQNQTAVKVSGGTDPTASFANSDAANTQKTITLTKPTGTIKKYHRLVFHNPSTETDLTVKIVNKGAIGTNTRWLLASFIIPAKQTITGTSIETDGRNIIADMFLGNVDVDIIISNNTALSGSGAFTTTVQVYAL